MPDCCAACGAPHARPRFPLIYLAFPPSRGNSWAQDGRMKTGFVPVISGRSKGCYAGLRWHSLASARRPVRWLHASPPRWYSRLCDDEHTCHLSRSASPPWSRWSPASTCSGWQAACCSSRSARLHRPDCSARRHRRALVAGGFASCAVTLPPSFIQG